MLFPSILILAFISCAKKKDCLSQESDEVWLVIKNSSGENLLNTIHQEVPYTVNIGSSGSLGHFERVLVNNGTNDEMFWKINLDEITSNVQYRVYTESDTFLLESQWTLENADCDYEDYTGRKLEWLSFEDTTYFTPGKITYVQ